MVTSVLGVLVTVPERSVPSALGRMISALGNSSPRKETRFLQRASVHHPARWVRPYLEFQSQILVTPISFSPLSFLSQSNPIMKASFASLVSSLTQTTEQVLDKNPIPHSQMQKQWFDETSLHHHRPRRHVQEDVLVAREFYR
ncbi:hypothetical protein Sjap_018053 [Stephania japonica]|uniref:Uncharacterized protein n=1 Tax=Stephania japonica TaxID=461633 RepID=A0AAP0I7A1_9MAGN